MIFFSARLAFRQRSERSMSTTAMWLSAWHASNNGCTRANWGAPRLARARLSSVSQSRAALVVRASFPNWQSQFAYLAAGIVPQQVAQTPQDDAKPVQRILRIAARQALVFLIQSTQQLAKTEGHYFALPASGSAPRMKDSSWPCHTR